MKKQDYLPIRYPKRVVKFFNTSSGLWLVGFPWFCKQSIENKLQANTQFCWKNKNKKVDKQSLTSGLIKKRMAIEFPYNDALWAIDKC